MRTDRDVPSKRPGFLHGPVGESVRDAFRAYFEPLIALKRWFNKDRTPYSAIFLTPDSHGALLSWWRSFVGTPLHPNVFAHHMTLAYNPSEKQRAQTPVGIVVQVRVAGYAQDEFGQAVIVTSKGGPVSLNKHPHVTVATAIGVEPFYSNELLSRGWTEVKDGPLLFGIVDIRDE